MTDEEQAAVADAVEVGQWTLEMDESRYRDLWVQSQLGNIAVLALTDDAMRRGVKRPKTRQ